MRTIDLDQKVTAVYFDDGRGEWHREATTVEELLQGNIDEDIHAISHDIPTIEQRWIPCSEQLPEDEQEILFSTKTGRVHSGRYHDDNSANQWYSHRDRCRAWNNVVSAWMPLPEPYKEEEG